jgi:hypothetical protein
MVGEALPPLVAVDLGEIAGACHARSTVGLSFRRNTLHPRYGAHPTCCQMGDLSSCQA